MPASSGDEVLRLLEKCFVFQALDEDSRAALAKHALRRTFRAGEPIFHLGDPGDSLIAIATGTVRVFLPTPQGKQIILANLSAGEVLGEISLLDGRERSAAVSAVTNCELLSIHRRDVLPFLRKRPDACLTLLSLLCSRVRKSDERMSDIAFFDLPARLAKTLVKQTGAPGSRSYKAKLSLSQTELANMVGATRENVNRRLRAWQRRGILDLKEGWIIVKEPESLAALAAPAY